MNILKAAAIISMCMLTISAAPSPASAQEEGQVDSSGSSVEPVVVGANEEKVLYVQEGCTHCAEVEKFIEDNNLVDEITIKDILIDEAASEELNDFMESNGVPLEERGVPVLVYGENLWEIGDEPIIDYLTATFEIDTSDEKDSGRDANSVVLAMGSVFVLAVVGYGIFQFADGKRRK